jgi:maleamate amidohydrolase
MNEAWTGFLSERDRQVLELLGFAARMGFGLRPALLVVDVNYEFAGEQALPLLESVKRWRTACGEEAWKAIKLIRWVIDAAHGKGVPVFYSTNSRRRDRWDAGSWRWKSAHEQSSAPRNPRADDIVEDIAPQPHDIVIAKTKPSVFFGTPFLSFLTDLKVDSLLVCGGTTSGCVRATVIDAFSHNLRCAVLADACFDRLETSHAASLVDMQAKYADVISTHEAVAFVGALRPGMFELPRGGA